MSNALTIYGQFDQMQRAAMALYKSGYFSDAKSEAQAIVKVMAGAELGLPPFASMAGIHIIKGKPVLGSNVMATLVKNDPRYDYQIKQADEKICVLQWFDTGRIAAKGGAFVGESSFTIEEAKRAGLTTKDNWKNYPSDMLFARAISRGVRRYAPGVFGGAPVYTPDEMGADVDEDGNVYEGEIVEEQAPPTEDDKPQPAPKSQPAKQKANGNGRNPMTAGQYTADYIEQEKNPYYTSREHVFGALRHMFGDDVGLTFGQRDILDYDTALDKYASENADKEAA